MIRYEEKIDVEPATEATEGMIKIARVFGCSGMVHQTLYVTPSRGDFRLITESDWFGKGAISSTKSLTKSQAAEFIALHAPALGGDKEELLECINNMLDC